MKYFVIIILILISSCSITPSVEHHACDSEVQTICPNIRPGEGRIGDCIKEHYSEFSKKCIAEKEESNLQHEKKFGRPMKICALDDYKYCSGVKKYSARRINCLKEKYLEDPNNLGSECREAFSKIVDIIPPVFP